MCKHKRNTRNKILNHPLLRKGGIHKKTNKALRRRDKIKLKTEWPAKKRLLTVVSWLVIQ